jgi:hypothetical protein
MFDSSRLKYTLALPAFALALLCSHAAFAPAQAPAGAPAGANGLCNDGTYSTAAVKSGACGGHKGVKTWFAPAPARPATTTAVTPPKAASPAIVAAPAPAPAAKPARSMPTPAATAAPGGGPGMVWVNTSTKVYHCPTDRYYGKTKAGSYMTESAAAAAGNKPDAGKKCF